MKITRQLIANTLVIVGLVILGYFLVRRAEGFEGNVKVNAVLPKPTPTDLKPVITPAVLSPGFGQPVKLPLPGTQTDLKPVITPSVLSPGFGQQIAPNDNSINVAFKGKLTFI
jgi:hypothetical protein